MTKKLTKKEMFEQIKGHLTDPQEIEFINHQIDLLNKKATGLKKLTATQIENEGFMDTILKILENSDKPLSITEIQALDKTLPTSNQKMSAILKKLVDSHVVEKIYLKRKPYFGIPE